MKLQSAFFKVFARNLDPTETCSRNCNLAQSLWLCVCHREVVQAGSAVISLKEGDSVASEPAGATECQDKMPLAATPRA